MTGNGRKNFHYENACAGVAAGLIRDPSTRLWAENTWGGGFGIEFPPQENVESRYCVEYRPGFEGKEIIL
jgi:hypothetical protein